LHEACVVDFAARQCQGGGGEQARIDQLVRALEHAVIPYLAQAHRPCEPSPLPLCAVPTAAEVQGFVAQLMVGADAPTQALLAQLRRRGMTVEALYLDLLAPAARLLGEYWDNDLADFAAVTVGLGQLQRLLRDLSPDFSIDLGSRAHARRVLLVQAPHEQHSFGLSMVAEFFRRDGWVVEGGVGTAAADPVVRVQNDWYDVIGFSLGSETRLRWLREKIAAVRLASRNPALVVMVGGPLFQLHPDWVQHVGADGTSGDAKDAPALATTLVAAAKGVSPAALRDETTAPRSPALPAVAAKA
jgi:methanogenic corrinoid protein MtbC1